MTGYKIITIDSLCDALGEDGLNTVLSCYSCPLNRDIEDFLLHKALAFSRQGLAKTHLVFASFQGKPKLVGYYALASKTLFSCTYPGTRLIYARQNKKRRRVNTSVFSDSL